VLTVIEFLIDGIFYGSGATTFILYFLSKRNSRLKIDLDTVIKSNNLLVLVRTFLLLLSVSITIISAWYSSTEYAQFALINRWTGPYAIFLWASILLSYLPPLLMLSKRNRSNLSKSVLIIAMWVINYLVYLFLAKLLINPSDWSIVIKPDYYMIAEGVLVYIFLLIGLSRILSMRTNRS